VSKTNLSAGFVQSTDAAGVRSDIVTATLSTGFAQTNFLPLFEVNTGGDLTADAMIRIAGVHALDAGAFLL